MEQKENQNKQKSKPPKPSGETSCKECKGYRTHPSPIKRSAFFLCSIKGKLRLCEIPINCQPVWCDLFSPKGEKNEKKNN